MVFVQCLYISLAYFALCPYSQRIGLDSVAYSQNICTSAP